MRNTGILSFTNIVNTGLLFLLSIYIARALGVIDFGKFSLAIAFSMIVFRFSDLGIGIMLKREVARNPSVAEKYLNNGISLRLISSAIAMMSVWVLVMVLGYPSDTAIAILLISFGTAATEISNLFISLFQGMEKMEYQAISTISASSAKFFLCTLAIILGYGIIAVCSLFMLSSILQMVISGVLTKKRFVRPGLLFDFDFWKKLIRESYPLAFALVFVMMYYRIDTVMLSMIKGEDAVGIYNAAYNILMGLAIIPSSFLPAVFPNLSRFFKESNVKLRKGFKKALMLMGLSGLTIAILGTIFAKDVISIIYGASYMESVLTLQILMWALLFLFMNNTVGITLNATNRQKANMFIVGTAVIVNIILNLLLVPVLTYEGAAIATLITEAYVLLSGLLIITKVIYFEKR